MIRRLVLALVLLVLASPAAALRSILIVGTGPPAGNISCPRVPMYYLDNSGAILYLCTLPGGPGEAVWQIIDTSGGSGSGDNILVNGTGVVSALDFKNSSQILLSINTTPEPDVVTLSLANDAVTAAALSASAIEPGDIEAVDLPPDGYASTYANVTGDTYSGAHNFSGAAVTIPRGDPAPPVSSSGEIAWDDDGCLVIRDGASGAPRTRTFCPPRIYYPDAYVDSTPNSDGIQGAIDAAAAEMEGGLVLLGYNGEVASTGHYNISAEADSVNYPGCGVVIKPNVIVVGAGGGDGSNDATIISIASTTLTNGVCLEGTRSALAQVRIQTKASLDFDGVTLLSVGSKDYPLGWLLDNVVVRGNGGLAGSADDADRCIKVTGLKGVIRRVKTVECDVGLEFAANAVGKPNQVLVEGSVFTKHYDASVLSTSGGQQIFLANTFESDADAGTANDLVRIVAADAKRTYTFVGNYFEGEVAGDIESMLQVGGPGAFILEGNLFGGGNSASCAVRADSGSPLIYSVGNYYDPTFGLCETVGATPAWSSAMETPPPTVPASWKTLAQLHRATVCDATVVGYRGDICLDTDASPLAIYFCEAADGKCDAAGEWKAVGSAGSSSSVKVDGVTVTDPDFVTSSSDIDFVATGSLITGNIVAGAVGTSEIADGSVQAVDLAAGVAGDSIRVETAGGPTYTAASDADFRDTSTIDVSINTTPSPDEITLDVKTASITATHIATGAVGADELASSGVTAGSYGDANNYPTFTVDADGRLTAASTQALPVRSAVKCATVESPVDADDLLFFRADAALTVTDIDCLSVGTTPSIAVVVNECDGNGSNCVAVETAVTCAATNGSDDGTIDNAAIGAGNWLRLAFGAPSGTVDQTSVCVRYTW